MLFRSDPKFDYSIFTELADKIKNGENIKSFGYTFNQEGHYVFVNSANPDLITVIGVMGDNLQCSNDEKYIQPMSASNLLKLGLSQTEDIILTPDWPLIFGLIGSILVIIPLLVWFMQYFTNSSWLKDKSGEIKYRELNKSGNFEEYTAKGKEWNREMVKPNGEDILVEEDDDKIGKPSQREAEIIEMRKKENNEGVHEISPDIFRNLYKELQFHAQFVKDEFAKIGRAHV